MTRAAQYVADNLDPESRKALVRGGVLFRFLPDRFKKPDEQEAPKEPCAADLPLNKVQNKTTNKKHQTKKYKK